MSNIEKKIINWMIQYKHMLFFIIVSFLGIVIRFIGKDILSADMNSFLTPWFNEIKHRGGVRALTIQVGDYNLLYQTLIAFMTYLKGNSVYYYKLLSCLFDYLLAFYCARFSCQFIKTKEKEVLFNFIYATILFLPTVVLNSAFWGQCDSIYTFFLILTLFYLYKEKYTRAFVYFGVALAFKFQAIFILPFIIAYYFYKKEFSIMNFAISLYVFWLSGIVAYVQGRDLLTPFKLYKAQTGTYPKMYMNIASFWVIFGDYYDALHLLAILLTMILCGLGLYAILCQYKSMHSLEQYLNTAGWFVWTCILFLPAMHDRYAYSLDLLLILLAFINRKYIKYAVVSFLLSFFTYGTYFFNTERVTPWHAFFYVAFWIHYTYTILKGDKVNNL